METNGIDRDNLWVVILGLTPQKDGDHFCFLWGTDIQSGVCSFGRSPIEAALEFEKEMCKEIKNNVHL